MNFSKLDYLVYSSHKTSTQSMLKILRKNKFNSIHCHLIKDLKYHYPNINVNEDIFIESLKNYKKENKKKIKIISIIREPTKRLISSFFQSYHTDELLFMKKQNKNTTISINNIENLLIKYEDLIKNNTLPGQNESLDQLSKMFNIDIIKNLINKKDYYYFNHELFELYVLDFNKLITSESLLYINKCLNINCIDNDEANISKNKSYFEKYNIMKTKIPEEINNIIKKRYNHFYFNAFSK
jgi:hypothetical protein